MEDILINSIPGVLIGAIIGGGIFATKGYFDRDKNLGKRLSFAPQNFEQDRALASTYLQLQRYRPFAAQAFDGSGDQVDNILSLERQLELGEVNPNMFHHGYALRYARSAQAFLKQMLHDIETKMRKRAEANGETPESIGTEMKEIQDLVKRIDGRLMYHVKNINGLYILSDKRMNTHLSRPLYQYNVVQ